MTLRAVIFDLGGTLTGTQGVIDPVDPWFAYVMAVDPHRADRWMSQLRAAEDAAWAACRDHSRSFTLSRMLEYAEVPYSPYGMAAYRAACAPWMRAAPEAAGLLAAVRDRGLRVGVLSNTVWPASWHLEALERDGLLPFLDASVFSSDLEYAKPHPDTFRTVLRALQVADPAAAVHVGDRLFEDVQGGTRAGLRTILVPGPPLPAAHRVITHARATAKVSSLGAVLCTVEAWLGQSAP
ncbi:HAD family hydrolase [Streptomyces tendae]|uniref:HAD family hydrolase n=1 Tax=Streptomyces tendae TaxID=1932 RepID=UPI0036480C6F